MRATTVADRNDVPPGVFSRSDLSVNLHHSVKYPFHMCLLTETHSPIAVVAGYIRGQNHGGASAAYFERRITEGANIGDVCAAATPVNWLGKLFPEASAELQ